MIDWDLGIQTIEFVFTSVAYLVAYFAACVGLLMIFSIVSSKMKDKK